MLFKKFLNENEIQIDKRLTVKPSSNFVDFFLDKKYIFRLSKIEIENILKNMKMEK